MYKSGIAETFELKNLLINTDSLITVLDLFPVFISLFYKTTAKYTNI